MLNKKRLAALGLSAVMVASTASLPVSAADFSDGSDVVAAQNGVVTDESEDFGVETADVEDAVGTENSVNENSDAENPAVDVADLEVKDGEIYYNVVYKDGTKSPNHVTATPHYSDLTCTEVQTVTWTATDPTTNKTLTVGPIKTEVIGKHTPVVLDGKWVEKTKVNGKESWKETGKPACGSKGTFYFATKGTVCSVCGEAIVPVETKTVTEVGHSHDSRFGGDPEKGKDAVTTYTPGENAKLNVDSHHVPVAKNPAKYAYYTKTTKYICDDCGASVTDNYLNESGEATIFEIAPTESQIKSIKVKAGSLVNIAKSNNLEGMDKKDIPDESEILLINCDEPGSYILTITYENEANEIVTHDESVTVAAHHVDAQPEVKAVDPADQKYLREVWAKDKDGNEDKTKLADVINTNCKKAIAYDIKYKCAAEHNAVYKTVRDTAAKSTTHTFNTTLKKSIEDIKKGNDYLNTYTLYQLNADASAKIVPESASCTKAGTVSVEFYCQVCGEKVATISGVNSIPLGHEETTVIENVKDATCEAAGSYDLVTKCKRCGETLKTLHMKGVKLNHTNEDADGIVGDTEKAEVYIKFAGNQVIATSDDAYAVGDVFDQSFMGDASLGRVTMLVYTNCATCHKNEVSLVDPTNVSLTVTSIKNATYTFDSKTKKYTMITPGTIGLKASYTRADGETVVVAETSLMYGNKANVEITASKKLGLQLDADGVLRYYVKEGVFDSTYVGLADFNGQTFYVKKGIVDHKDNGLKLVDGKWYNLAESRVTREHTGAVAYDGAWFYVSNGIVNEAKSGLADYNGGTFLFTNGRLRYDVNGLWLDPTTGIWYFLANGQVQTQHTGVAMYDGAFFYIEKGQLAKDYKGTVTYDGAKFNVVEGQLYGPIK